MLNLLAAVNPFFLGVMDLIVMHQGAYYVIHWDACYKLAAIICLERLLGNLVAEAPYGYCYFSILQEL